MPLLWYSLAFLLGLGLCALAPNLPFWPWLVLAGLGLALAFSNRRLRARFPRLTRLPVIPGLLLVLAALGAARLALENRPFTPTDLAYYNDQGSAVLVGQVAADPDRRDNATLVRVRAERITLDGETAHEVGGLALVRLPAGASVRYGDRVTLTGAPLTPPEDEQFSYRAYLARQGIHTYFTYPRLKVTGAGQTSPFWRFTYVLRQRAYNFINRAYPQPEAGLLAGILLGLERDLPEGLESAFQLTGTAHIIAISGFNMAILAALFLTGFGRMLPLGPASLAAAVAIGFYTLLVGANPAVVRAAVMASAGLLGGLLGRRGVGFNSLAFTAALMCLFDPRLPGDASFQLSFAATLGLVLYAGPLQAWFERLAARRLSRRWVRRLSGPVSDYLLLTLAAQVTTLPITLYHFQRISWVTLLANPLVLPPQPLLMILGGLSVLAGLIWAPLGQLLALPAWPLAAYTTRMVAALAGLPGAGYSPGYISAGIVLGLYALLLAFTVFPRTFPALRRSVRPAAILLSVGLLAAFGGRSAAALPDGRLHISVLALDGGPAYLVRAPSGLTLLAGGASSANELSAELGQRLPPADHRLDVVLLNGRGLAGLPVTLERYPPEQAAWLGKKPSSASARRLEDQLENAGLALQTLAPGALVELGEGVQVEVLAAGDGAAALRLSWGKLRVIIPGGISPAKLGEAARGASLLVLTPADWKDTPPEDWSALGAQVTAACGPGSDPMPPEWVTVTGMLEVVSDGEQMWLSLSN